ncbi:fumarylacetoacetate hydrolase family protein [Hypoxylon sp. FL0543]|nr:fumarylacetoacetate hydrolase family protein [Hypoxylon sp. FL0543]
MPAFNRLIRFLAKNGKTYYGDAILPEGVTDVAKTKKARVIKGDIFGKHEVTDQIADVRLLLAPLALEDVKTVRCLGLNYALHAKEAGLPLPKYPVLFFKPVTSLSGPTDPIPVHPIAQEELGLDYECELVVVIGKEAKDVPEDKALDYVLGYAVGNDVSHRDWQVARGGGQWSLGKGFDGWAPYGPGIVTSNVIKDPQTLKITTRLNGQTVQESNTADQIFNVKQTISFLSRGHTLLPGDLIWTGTPSGVGMGRNPKLWMKDGDIVEVELEGVGVVTNKVEFIKEDAPKL